MTTENLIPADVPVKCPRCGGQDEWGEESDAGTISAQVFTWARFEDGKSVAFDDSDLPSVFVPAGAECICHNCQHVWNLPGDMLPSGGAERFVRELIASWPWDTDETINGGDLTAWIGARLDNIKKLLATAEAAQKEARAILDASDPANSIEHLQTIIRAGIGGTAAIEGAPEARACLFLRAARDLLVAAKHPRAADKVRRALKSAEGAERHGDHMRSRAALENIEQIQREVEAGITDKTDAALLSEDYESGRVR